MTKEEELIERYQIAMKATISPAERLALTQGIDKELLKLNPNNKEQTHKGIT